ncbi:MAG: VWA domain-containing protein [Pseudomonadales bacterium]|nr:VWA domain-containing protein [Pseudomonadales bacterium]
MCSTAMLVVGLYAEAMPDNASEQRNDIRLIIDISGSMKQNDPENLRVPAVNLLVNLLPTNASAGVWTFGQQVNMLVPYQAIDDRWKKAALSNTNRINSTGLYTNIGVALEQVLLAKGPAGTAILLTDGVVDISKDPSVNRKEKAWIVNQLLPRLVAAGALVHTVALSANADANLLQELARSTGGIFDIASTPDELTSIFLRMFDDAVEQDRLPLQGGQFSVDSSVEEFTLLAFSGDDAIAIQLRSPANEFYLKNSHPNFVQWYEDSGFELITVKQPVEGEWQLFADEDPQNRVTVLSNLKLQVTNLNNTVYVGDVPALKISFSNDGQRIIDAKFLDLMDVQLLVRKPSGARVGTPLTEYSEGVFSTALAVLDEPGRYQLKVSVDGRTFKRESVQEIEYQQPVQIEFMQEQSLLKVVPASIGLFSDQLNVIAAVKDANGKRSLLPMSVVDGEYWQASLSNFSPGQYDVALHIKGTTSAGQFIDYNAAKMQVVIGAAELQDVPQTDPALADDVVQQDGIFTRIIDWLTNNPLYVGAGLANFLIAGAAYWFFKKRAKIEDEDEDAELTELLAGQDGSAVDEPAAELEAEPDPESDDKFGAGLSEIVDAWGDEDDEDVPAPIELEDIADPSDNTDPLQADLQGELDNQPAAGNDSELDEALQQASDKDDGEVLDTDALIDEMQADTTDLEEAAAADTTADFDPDSLIDDIQADGDVADTEVEIDPDSLIDDIQADGDVADTEAEFDPDSLIDDIQADADAAAADTELSLIHI